MKRSPSREMSLFIYHSSRTLGKFFFAYKFCFTTHQVSVMYYFFLRLGFLDSRVLYMTVPVTPCTSARLGSQKTQSAASLTGFSCLAVVTSKVLMKRNMNQHNWITELEETLSQCFLASFYMMVNTYNENNFIAHGNQQTIMLVARNNWPRGSCCPRCSGLTRVDRWLGTRVICLRNSRVPWHDRKLSDILFHPHSFCFVN